MMMQGERLASSNGVGIMLVKESFASCFFFFCLFLFICHFSLSERIVLAKREG